MIISCGIIIENSFGNILGCHGTGRIFGEGTFDIPKGQMEPGETPINCVIRECFEETGIRLDPKRIIDLGIYDYLPNKKLHLFKYNINVKEFDLNTLRCISTFDRNGKQIPEVNGYKWFPKSQLFWYYKSLVKVLEKVLK